MKKRIIYLSVLFVVLVGAIIAFIKIAQYQKSNIKIQSEGLKNIIDGHWISCGKDDCMEFSYDKKTNLFAIGLLQSDAVYTGEINTIADMGNYRYDVIIYHSRTICDEKDTDCKMMCDEINCEESSRTYSIDTNYVTDKKLYIKLYGYEGFMDKYASYENRDDYTYNDNLPKIFKNNRDYLEE